MGLKAAVLAFFEMAPLTFICLSLGIRLGNYLSFLLVFMNLLFFQSLKKTTLKYSLPQTLTHLRKRKFTFSLFKTIASFFAGGLTQVLGVGLIPFLYSRMGVDHWVCILLPFATLMVSHAIGAGPPYSELTVTVTRNTKPKSPNSRMLKNKIKISKRNFRYKVFCFFNLFRMISIVITASILIKHDPKLEMQGSVMEFIRSLTDITGNSHAQIVWLTIGATSVFAYVAYLTFVLHIHRYALLPTLFLIPMVLVLNEAFCSTNFMRSAHPCFNITDSDHHDVLAIVLFAFLSISQFAILFEKLWDNKLPLLAKQDTLFKENYYQFLVPEALVPIKREKMTEKEWSQRIEQDPQLQHMNAKVYLATTMYNEDHSEMKGTFRSHLRTGQLNNKWQSHIVHDGGVKNGEEVSDLGARLINAFQDAVEECYPELQAEPLQFKKFKTFYGLRLEFSLPNGSTFVTHLKDPALVKNKKRWSQVLYKKYIVDYLQSKAASEQGHPENTISHDRYGEDEQDVNSDEEEADVKNSLLHQDIFILMTDADVQFEPKAVISLLVRLLRDHERVGAVCGRILPAEEKIPGLLLWYQKYEYARGHWFEKATEHVFGTVLCTPGCFTMIRGRAFAEVADEYSSSSTTAMDFLTKDMGEDRLLCTLLIAKGWKLEYIETALCYTHCPVGMKQFYAQRVRWNNSTTCNQVIFLLNQRKIRENHDHICALFVLYQAVLLFNTLIAPGTIIVVLAGGLSWATTYSMLSWIIALVVIDFFFLLLCILFTRDQAENEAIERIQLTAAKFLTAFYALVMFGVMITWLYSISNQLADGTYFSKKGLSLTSIFLLLMFYVNLFGASLHITEAFEFMAYSVIYFFGIPGAYKVLFLYSLAKMNSQSWGTRVIKATVEKITIVTNFFRGLGKKDDEPWTYFFGRLVRCRPYDANEFERPQVPDLEENFDGRPQSVNVLVDPELDEIMKAIDSHISEECSAEEISFWNDHGECLISNERKIREAKTEEAVAWLREKEEQDRRNLKHKLSAFRNNWVVSVMFLNAAWILAVYLFIKAMSDNLGVLNSSLLGAGFLLVYGIVILLQLYACFSHRYEYFIQTVAEIHFNPSAYYKQWLTFLRSARDRRVPGHAHVEFDHTPILPFPAKNQTPEAGGEKDPLLGKTGSRDPLTYHTSL